MSSKWIVEMIDPGCDCCSYIGVAEFDTEQEAIEYVGDDDNLSIYDNSYYPEGENNA